MAPAGATGLRLFFRKKLYNMKKYYEIYLKSRNLGTSITICITPDRDIAGVVSQKTNVMLERLAEYFHLKDRHKEHTLSKTNLIFCVSAIDYLFQKAGADKMNLNINSKEEFIRKYISFKKGSFMREVFICNTKLDGAKAANELDFNEGVNNNVG